METKHPGLKDKPLEFQKKKKMWTWRIEAVLEGHHFIKCVYTESIILSGWLQGWSSEALYSWWGIDPTKDICQELLGEASVQKVAQVALLASTITRQTDETAEDIEA